MLTRAIVAVVSLGIGFTGGWVTRPLASPSPNQPAVISAAPLAAVPDQREATDAVRPHRAGIASLEHAGVTLGGCDPQGNLARCAIDLAWDDRRPGTVQRRVATFGRIAGRWEVVIW